MKAGDWLNVLLAAPIAALLCAVSSPTIASEKQLHFLSWPDYIDSDLIEKFERQNDIDIVRQEYISDAQRDTFMQESKGQGYDIILVNGMVLENYIRKGWTTALPEGYTEKLHTIDKRWWHAYHAAEWYAVPYFWGTLGIAYRSDLVSPGINSWMELFRPNTSLRGKVSIMSASRETIGMALKALDYSLNTRSSAKVNKALTMLKEQYPHYQAHAPMDALTQSKLVSGELHAAMMYSGTVQIMQRLDNRIKYVVPKEGGSIWVDYLVVSSKSKNKQAAWDFIEFINEPEHATQLAYYLYYATTNKGALALLDQNFLDNETIYPDPKALEKSEILQPLLSRRQKELQAQFDSLATQ